MNDVINLRLVRKRRQRAADAIEADANRLRFGQPARDRRLAEARLAQQGRYLDGHKLEDRPARAEPQGKGRSEP
ncbi:MAG: DUF4169 family protein [Phreatobacter sp.]